MLKLIQEIYPCNNEIAALINAMGAERYITNLNKLIPITEIKIYILQFLVYLALIILQNKIYIITYK